MEYIIDYLSFTIKNDKNVADEARLYELNVPFVFDILGLSCEMDCFMDMGAKQHYAHMYYYNYVRVYECSEIRPDMGIHVELTSQGCRYIEKRFSDNNNGAKFNWFTFFKKLYLLIEGGLAINICRIDYAVDDKQGILDMEEIRECTIKGERVSLYHNFDSDFTLPECREIESGKFIDGELIVGKTLYFGNKKSTSFCRIYDKKAEQMVKCVDKEKLKELKKLKHWIRFEIIFRNKTAIKHVNAMIRLTPKEFAKYLAATINSYIRFVNLDDSNRTRRSLKDFWAKFIGTVERAKLGVEGLSVNALARAKNWLDHSLAPTLSALIERLGKDSFFELIERSDPKSRYKSKHISILNAENFEDIGYTNLEYWNSLVPRSLSGKEVLV